MDITIIQKRNDFIGADALALIEGFGTMSVSRNAGRLTACWPCEPRSAAGGRYPGLSNPRLSEGQNLLAQAIYSSSRRDWQSACDEAAATIVDVVWAEGPRQFIPYAPCIPTDHW